MILKLHKIDPNMQSQLTHNTTPKPLRGNKINAKEMDCNPKLRGHPCRHHDLEISVWFHEHGQLVDNNLSNEQ